VNQSFLVESLATKQGEARDAEEENIPPDRLHNISFEFKENLTAEPLAIETLKQDDDRGRTL